MKKTADFDQKPTLIFIHGMRGNHHGLVDLARYMRNEYNVLVPDIPGSGDRAELKNKTNDGYADWLHQYIAAQKFTQKPIIIGHSMGSILTSNFIRKYPNDIDQCVIYLSPILRDRKAKKRSIRLYRFAKFNLSIIPPFLAYAIERSKLLSYIISHILVSDKTKQKYIDQLHYRYSGRFSSHKSFIADMKISMCETTWLTDKKNTLVVFGKLDTMTPYQYAQNRCKKYNIKFKLVEDAGHLLNYERPAEVAKIMSDFLAENR